jgi:hypothetical protein
MGEFVRQEVAPRRCIRLVLAITEDDVPSEREGSRFFGARTSGGFITGVDANLAEVVAERTLKRFPVL